MLELRMYGPVASLRDVGAWLEASGMVRRVVLQPTLQGGQALLAGEVHPEAADKLLAALHERGVERNAVALVRVEDITPPVGGRRPVSLVWADMIGQARRNARPLARYLVFMMIAGVIAAYGVITANSTLIVGAMAVSPDTLPITAACVGIVSGQLRLALRSIGTLALGLAATCLAAAGVTLLLSWTHRMPAHYDVSQTPIQWLVAVGVGTVGVAFAAGIAAMLSLETRASSAVGVAISVTTIPATAYLGVAVAVSGVARVSGALAVLGVNIVMLLVGGTGTLAVQRHLTDGPPETASWR